MQDFCFFSRMKNIGSFFGIIFVDVWVLSVVFYVGEYVYAV